MGGKLQARGCHLRSLSGTSNAAAKKQIRNLGGRLPLTIHPRPSLPSLGQGEESKWMRTQSKGEF